MEKLNNTNDYSRRTAATVKFLLKRNGLICDVENCGDNRHFNIIVPAGMKNIALRYKLKKIGFILLRGAETDSFIPVKCY